jgi:hypothetical protein
MVKVTMYGINTPNIISFRQSWSILRYQLIIGSKGGGGGDGGGRGEGMVICNGQNPESSGDHYQLISEVDC